MPDVYFNSETGTTSDLNKALSCIVRAVNGLKQLEQYVAEFYMGKPITEIMYFPIYRDKKGAAKYLQEAFGIARGDEKDVLRYLGAKITKGKVCTPDIESDWILKGIGAPSNLLHFVAVNHGMALTFATESEWERDFIEFENQDAAIPNIWGQCDVSSLTRWIKENLETGNSYVDRLNNWYNVTVCGSCLVNSDFLDKDWKTVFDKFRLAEFRRYIPDNDLIKKFYDIKAGALCELVVTGSIRLFFVHYGGRVLIGEKYVKGQCTDAAAQQRAAKVARQRIDAYVLNQQLSERSKK